MSGFIPVCSFCLLWHAACCLQHGSRGLKLYAMLKTPGSRAEPSKYQSPPSSYILREPTAFEIFDKSCIYNQDTSNTRVLSVSFIWIRCVLVEPLPALHIPRHRARAYRLAKLRSHARFITVSHEGQLIVAATNENVLSHFRLRPRDRSLMLVSPLRVVSTSRLVRLSLSV